MKQKHDLKYDKYKEYEVLWEGKNAFVNAFKQWGDSYSHRFRFNNGYGASVIKHFASYGYEDDLFELAVLDRYGKICYNTPITNDVVGHLTNDEVLDLLELIKNLEKR